MTQHSRREPLRSVEVWCVSTNTWQQFGCPTNTTVAQYATWCVGEENDYWATVNSATDKLRLNGWLVVDGQHYYSDTADNAPSTKAGLSKQKRNRRIIVMLRNGVPTNDIASMHCISPTTVKRIAKKHEVPLKRGRPADPDRDEMIREFLAWGMKYKDIAERVGYAHPNSVLAAIHRMNRDGHNIAHRRRDGGKNAKQS